MHRALTKAIHLLLHHWNSRTVWVCKKGVDLGNLHRLTKLECGEDKLCWNPFATEFFGWGYCSSEQHNVIEHTICIGVYNQCPAWIADGTEQRCTENHEVVAICCTPSFLYIFQQSTCSLKLLDGVNVFDVVDIVLDPVHDCPNLSELIVWADSGLVNNLHCLAANVLVSNTVLDEALKESQDGFEALGGADCIRVLDSENTVCHVRGREADILTLSQRLSSG